MPGILRALLSGRASDNPAIALPEHVHEVTTVGKKFDVNIDSGTLYGTPTFDDYIYGNWRISRQQALKVTPVKRARDLIAGAIGQLPLRVYAPDGSLATDFSPSLFPQAEAGVVPSITWTRVVEDMLLDEVAWLKVESLAWHGRPSEVLRLDPETVTVQKVQKSFGFGTAQVWPDVEGLIRIDSPNPGILVAGASAIRAVIALQQAALLYSTGAPQQDWFEPTDGNDPYDDDDLDELLDDWQERRRTRSTGYVPSGLAYKINNLKALDMQLAEARDFATLECARLTGIDADDLSVSTTSRTYQNVADKYRFRASDVLGPYMTAIEQRMSMPDITPNGYTARFDLSGYLRTDDYTAAKTDAVLVQAGITTRNEVRAKRGLDSIEGGDELATPTPVSAKGPADD